MWVPAAIAAVALLSACSRGAEPQAVAEPTRWDPCSITPEQIAATGLDPDYREVGWGRGIEVPEWAICSFRPVGLDIPYVLSVKSSLERTVEEAREKSSNINGRDVEFGGRAAFQYETKVAQSVDSCHAAMDLSPGVAVFTVNYLNIDDGVDPCPVLLKHVDDLEKVLPPETK